MPNYFPGTGFSPDVDKLQSWLGTRKNERVIANLTLPGLFDTANFTSDSIVAFLALFADIAGIVVLMYFGRFNTLVVVVGCTLIAIDIFGAFLAHSRVVRKTALKNLKILRSGNYPNLDQKDELSLKGKRRIVEVIGIALIAASGAAKVMGIIALGRGVMAIIIGLIIIYVIIAYIHLKITGYVIWEFMVNSKFKKAKRRLLDNGGQADADKGKRVVFRSTRDLVPDKQGDTELKLFWKSSTYEHVKYSKEIVDDYDKALMNEINELKKNGEVKVAEVVLGMSEDSGLSSEEFIKQRIYIFECSGIPTDKDIEVIANKQFAESKTQFAESKTQSGEERNNNIRLVVTKGLELQLNFLDLASEQVIPETLN